MCIILKQWEHVRLPVVSHFLSQVPLMHISVKDIVADVGFCSLHELDVNVPLVDVKLYCSIGPDGGFFQ